MGQRPKKVCVHKIGLKFPAPLIHFIFLPEEIFSDVGRGVGRWVGRSAGAGQPPPPPPPGGFLEQ